MLCHRNQWHDWKGGSSWAARAPAQRAAWIYSHGISGQATDPVSEFGIRILCGPIRRRAMGSQAAAMARPHAIGIRQTVLFSAEWDHWRPALADGASARMPRPYHRKCVVAVHCQIAVV